MTSTRSSAAMRKQSIHATAARSHAAGKSSMSLCSWPRRCFVALGMSTKDVQKPFDVSARVIEMRCNTDRVSANAHVDLRPSKGRDEIATNTRARSNADEVADTIGTAHGITLRVPDAFFGS